MRNIAQSRTHIKRRVDQYIWSDASVSLIRLREILRSHFMGWPNKMAVSHLDNEKVPGLGIFEIKQEGHGMNTEAVIEKTTLVVVSRELG